MVDMFVQPENHCVPAAQSQIYASTEKKLKKLAKAIDEYKQPVSW